MSNKNLTETKFSAFSLADELQKGIEATGFTFCTPIQAETLPHTLAGHDIAGQAQTGTGKTAAFAIALFNKLLTTPSPKWRKQNQPRALILAPTRELAIQIHKDAAQIGEFTGLKLGLAYGGTGYETQKQAIEDGLDILIGTPGRVIDYFKKHVFNLDAAEVLILDEADRMFDLGFIKDIRFLLRRMPHPEKRLNMLFSATLSHRVMELAYEHMNNPKQVEIIAEKVTADKVKQSVFYPASDEKIPLLLGLIKREQPERSILFVNTKRVADKVWSFLEGNGIKTAILSGDVPQNKRQSLLKQFKEGNFPMLVATDVAARGLHVPDVSHVFNYDLPQEAEDYVHRIGRTARAGASGTALSFACEEYAFSLMDIETYIHHKIPVESITAELLVKPQPPVKIERKPRPPRKDGGHRHHKGNHAQNSRR
ncbi:MAG: ATP-dependent RNA helicase RhlB [Chromatiales bacterium]|nr:ATP-dependent RNA helicase RhlB [Chromatiales bacterium]